MKKVLIFILILIMLTSTAGVAYARDGKVYDRADMFSDSAEKSIAWSLNVPAWVTQAVFIYIHEDDIEHDYAVLKNNSYIALFIDVDSEGNFEAAKVKCNSSYAPSDEYIEHYLNLEIPIMKKGEFADAITSFFSIIGSYVDRMHLSGAGNGNTLRQEMEEEVLGSDDTDYSVLYIGIFISVIVAIVIASVNVKRLLKQLKTVSYSKNATPYINKEYISIRSEMEEASLWSLLS